MGRYLDLAADVIVGLDTGSQCEKRELSEKTPQGETWGAAAASTKIILLHAPPGVPGAWVQGVADLLTMAPPTSYPAEDWAFLREDACRFLPVWAAQAHALSWTAFDLFGVHHTNPWPRLDCAGLVPLLGGREVAAISEDWAAIKTTEGRTLTYRRKTGPCPNGACLLWELNQ